MNKVQKKYGVVFMVLLFLTLHIVVHLNYWDDLAWKDSVKSGNYRNAIDFIMKLYNTTDGRLVLNATHWYLSVLPGFVWRTFDFAVVILFYHDICRLCLKKDAAKYWYTFIAIIICIYPFSLQATAGWMTTTTNYLWPEAFGLYTIIVLLDIIDEKRVSIFQKVLALFCAVYAGSEYMSGSILVISLLIICVKAFSEKKKVFFCIFNIIVAAVMLFLLTFSPSNKKRSEAVSTLFGGFNLSLYEKLRWALSSIFAHFLAIPSAMLTLFCLTILGLALFINVKRRRVIFIGCIPLFLDVVWSVYFFTVYTIGRRKMTYVHYLATPGICEEIEQIILAISFGLLCISSLYVLFNSLKNTKEKIFCTYVLACGLAPAVVLGMTPMMDQSLIRVITYLYFAFIVTIIFIVTRYYSYLDRIIKDETVKNRVKKIYLCTYKAVMVIGVLLNILQLVHHITTYG